MGCLEWPSTPTALPSWHPSSSRHVSVTSCGGSIDPVGAMRADCYTTDSDNTTRLISQVHPWNRGYAPSSPWLSQELPHQGLWRVYLLGFHQPQIKLFHGLTTLPVKPLTYTSSLHLNLQGLILVVPDLSSIDRRNIFSAFNPSDLIVSLVLQRCVLFVCAFLKIGIFSWLYHPDFPLYHSSCWLSTFCRQVASLFRNGTKF